MNVDHIYRPAIAERVAVAAREVTGYIDTDRTLGADDMKVSRDEAGHIRAIAKTLTTFDCGYVGMTQVPAEARGGNSRLSGSSEEGEGPGAQLPLPIATGYQNQADAPPCHSCGTIMVRNGACYKCTNCGSTSGCS